MTERERVAVVSPREERRHSAETWAPLLSDRADLRLCSSPGEEEVRDADVVVVDEACPDLDLWIAQASSAGRESGSIVVFGTEGKSLRGAVPWGDEGTDVLATIADLLDRRRLLHESDSFLEDLRLSNERLEGERRRFAKLVLAQAEALRGTNVSLSREVEELGRLQSLTRFFAAPGPEDTYAARLAEVLGGVLSASGVAIARRSDGTWSLWGQWRISRRNALGIVPERDGGSSVVGPRASTRKGTDGWWIPLGAPNDVEVGVVVVLRRGEPIHRGLGDRFLESVRSLLGEGIEARIRAEDLVSRQTQSERIVQTLRGGLLRVDGRGRILLSNPACESILGRPPSSLEDRTLDEAFPDDPHFRELLAAAARTGRALDDHETYVTWPGGRHVSVSVRISPLLEGGGEGILVLLSDLSWRKQVEAEMRKADRLAALGRLSAGVAHEIRNPLAGIRTTAEVLRNRIESDDELHRFVDVILEETARLDRIVGSLLQFAKPPRPRLGPLDVPGVLDRARRLAEGRAADRRVTIRVDETPDVPRPLADRDQILQVLLNLLLNGIEATPEGGEVRLSAERETTDGESGVRIVVRDQGEGVPTHIRDRIFDPFFTTKPGGTGLGLSISQNILRQHGGTLRVESGSDGATRAVVTLPVRRAASRPETGGNPWRTS
jgi:PAS domain S-box-containing protein